MTTMDGTIDLDLFKRFKQTHDQRCFAELYTRLYKPVWAYAQSLVDDRSTADEISQEAFLRFLKSKFDPEYPEANIKSFLIGMVKRIALEYWRARKRQPSVDHTLLELVEALTEIAVDGDADQSNELLRRVYRCFSKLREDQQALVAMHIRRFPGLWQGISVLLGWTHEDVVRIFEKKWPGQIQWDPKSQKPLLPSKPNSVRDRASIAFEKCARGPSAR
jgi:RNA polymerase sigma factor (sigma-70 family)